MASLDSVRAIRVTSPIIARCVSCSANPGWRGEERVPRQAGTKLGRDVTAQVGPLIVLERAANLASGLNKDG